MNLKEFRKVMTSHNKSEEEFKNHFRVITDYVTINKVLTIKKPTELYIVKTGNRNVLWIDDDHIDLKDVTALRIAKYENHI